MYFVFNVQHLSSPLLQCRGCIFNKYWSQKAAMYLWVSARPILTLCSDSMTLFSHGRGLQPMVGRSWHNKNSWKHPLKLCLFIGAFTCTHHKKAAHRLYFSGICLPLQLYEQIQRYSVRILHSVFLLYLHPPSISLRKSNKELTQATAFESCCPLTAAQGPLWQGHYL